MAKLNMLEVLLSSKKLRRAKSESNNKKSRCKHETPSPPRKMADAETAECLTKIINGIFPVSPRYSSFRRRESLNRNHPPVPPVEDGSSKTTAPLLDRKLSVISKHEFHDECAIVSKTYLCPVLERSHEHSRQITKPIGPKEDELDVAFATLCVLNATL